MPAEPSPATRRRLRSRRVRYALLGLLAVLLVQFFRMQVLRSSRYVLRAEENRWRAVDVPAARGSIYDRDGRVVAENVPGYAVTVLPASPDSVRRSLARLGPYLELDSARQETLMQVYLSRPNAPLRIDDQVDFRAVSAIQARRPEFRRVTVEMQPRRRYPAGRAIAHVVGYVGEVSAAELETPPFEDYRPGRIVGKAGVERQYESRLGGRHGVRYVVVNAVGSVVRELAEGPGRAPNPGDDLRLGLDVGLQAAADSLFPEGRKGGVVALDPRTGEVLLYYSHPTYDPNRFVGGVPSDYWASLRDDPDRPLLDRVRVATYPPGSTWKLLISTVAMRTGTATIDTRMPEACDGTLRYGIRTFRCWKTSGHGALTLSGAIKESCNVYFYQLGTEVGLDALLAGAHRLGFGRATGIDMPFESTGMIPPSREWYDRRYGRYGWTESVALNLAIGQGENQETLLRMAQFYAALATGRSPVVPHLLRDEALASRRVGWSLGLEESRRRDLVDALVRVVNEPGGTAYAHRLERWTLAGKTGTAQNPQGEPHSWFVGFAPAEDPRIVIAAIVEHGHPDNTTSLAVPYASGLVRRYLASSGIPATRPTRVAGEDR